MAAPSITALVCRLRAVDPTSDGELARRFYADDDQDAFELLIHRHAPMVLRVCRAVVGDSHLAEDAAQAVFLVLARKARTVAGLRSAAGWLARVAYRAATRMRTGPAIRRAGPLAPATAVVAAEPGPVEAVARAEQAVIVHQEVNRLPDRFHLAIVLCYFEGLTITQAADRLGLPAGTVAGHLARARVMLRRRLTRRGVTVPSAGLAALFGGSDRAAAVTTAACRAVRNQSAVPPEVRDLAEEVIQVMGTTRRTYWAAALVFGLIGATVVAGTGDPPERPAAAGDPPPADAAPRKNEFIVVGKVVDETRKVGMEGVKVWASAGIGTLHRTGETTTDKDGKFRLVFRPGVLMAGGKVGGQSAVVWVAKPGYYAWSYGWPASYLLVDTPPPADEKDTTRRTVLTPGTESRLEFRMAPAATLKTKIIGPDGRPLAKARVWLTGDRLPPGSSVLSQGETDADGVWVATDVARGRYRLVIEDKRDQWGELELGSIRFAEPVEYTAEATIHAMSDVETRATLKVTRPAK